jgi:hypothetical protein
VNIVALIDQLRDGLCVENDRCRIRNAASGCDCAIIADLIESQQAKIDRLQAALTRIAAFDDPLASNHLEAHGSYGAFDESGSVRVAREALAE